MKHAFLISVLILCTAAGSALAEQEATVAIGASMKLNELASLTEGISVSHTPDPLRYKLYASSISGVQWQHSTSVSSIAGPVEITEFGYFVERNGQWEFPFGDEIPYVYTSEDFAEKYDCPSSELQPGESYSNPLNRSIIDCVPEQDVMWYFIGRDALGNKVKGESRLKLLAELDPSEHSPQN